MNPSAHTTPSPPLRLLVIGGAEFMGSRKATQLLRWRCDIVTFGSQWTAYRDVASGSEALPLVENKSASSQTRQWQPTHFDLKSVIEDAWKWECKVCPPSLVEPNQLQA